MVVGTMTAEVTQYRLRGVRLAQYEGIEHWVCFPAAATDEELKGFWFRLSESPARRDALLRAAIEDLRQSDLAPFHGGGCSRA